MPHPMIQARGLSKCYRLGSSVAFGHTFREMLVDRTRQLFGKRRRREESDESFWALRDVSFDVQPGEVVGVIGHNGAGKSTLLKLLSRITDPSEGEARIAGRVASLLEVGTGFHPELTGRENIYLNGSILGMTRGEITRQFDAIVDFSGVERFLDTPVKRYSSGMTVRLAFAIAAHLQPEILLVDEVLAVGDVAFQKKSLGKMQDVVHDEGRTVLFVSHNMDSIRALCDHVMVLDHGELRGLLATDDAIRLYYELLAGESEAPLLERRRARKCDHAPVFAGVTLRGETGERVVPCGGALDIDIDLTNLEDVTAGECGVIIRNEQGQRVVLFQSQYHADLVLRGVSSGKLRCTIPNLNLAPGTYHVDLALFDQPEVIDWVERAATFDIVFADLFGTGKIPDASQGHVVLPSEWKLAA